jgi:ABC-type molybdenum transport system ATPase subunit/photorepair protein PhrA
LVATGLHRTDLLLLSVTRAQARRVTATLRLCGLYRHATRDFLSLSYGQKRLALLARALVQDPDWLLLDEFYNGLDPHHRRRIDKVPTAQHAAVNLSSHGASSSRRAARNSVYPASRGRKVRAAGIGLQISDVE